MRCSLHNYLSLRLFASLSSPVLISSARTDRYRPSLTAIYKTTIYQRHLYITSIIAIYIYIYIYPIYILVVLFCFFALAVPPHALSSSATIHHIPRPSTRYPKPIYIQLIPFLYPSLCLSYAPPLASFVSCLLLACLLAHLSVVSSIPSLPRVSLLTSTHLPHPCHRYTLSRPVPTQVALSKLR